MVQGKNSRKVAHFQTYIVNSLGGADFQIIPTNNICLLTTCEQAHFVFPHVLAAPSVAGQPTSNVGSEPDNRMVSRTSRPGRQKIGTDNLKMGKKLPANFENDNRFASFFAC